MFSLFEGANNVCRLIRDLIVPYQLILKLSMDSVPFVFNTLEFDV